MKLATRIFLVVFWFCMGIFWFVMFSMHGIRGDIAPVVAFLGVTVFGFGAFFLSCYCLADLAKFVYKIVREDFEKSYISLKDLEKPTEKPEANVSSEK